MYRLFDDTYGNYRNRVNDSEMKGNSRGVRGAGCDTPTQQNLEKLFDVMHRFVREYLETYYPRISPVRMSCTATRRRWLGSTNSARAFPTDAH